MHHLLDGGKTQRPNGAHFLSTDAVAAKCPYHRPRLPCASQPRLGCIHAPTPSPPGPGPRESEGSQGPLARPTPTGCPSEAALLLAQQSIPTPAPSYQHPWSCTGVNPARSASAQPRILHAESTQISLSPTLLFMFIDFSHFFFSKKWVQPCLHKPFRVIPASSRGRPVETAILRPPLLRC